MSYTTPPILEPSLQQELTQLTNLAAQDADLIAEKMFTAAIQAAGITPKVSLKSLTQLVNSIIVPTTHQWEGLWSDHPNDSGGATNRGIILSTFTSSFDYIFIQCGTPRVRAAAQNFNARRGTWKTNSTIGKQALYVVGNNEKVAGLWIVKFLCDKSCRYPIAVMSEDAFLGFFLAECCWGSGPGCYQSNGFDTLARQYGWNGNTADWPSFCVSLGSRSPEFAAKLVEKRLQFILNISKPGSKNNVFRKGWLRRLANDTKNSNIAMLVKINEIFNLNSNGLFKLTQQELSHLNTKAESYKTFAINVPT